MAEPDLIIKVLMKIEKFKKKKKNSNSTSASGDLKERKISKFFFLSRNVLPAKSSDFPLPSFSKFEN
jgi:hypothetical protein